MGVEGLNKYEEQQLFEITEATDATIPEKTGAHLLLGNQKSAEIYLDKLTDEEREKDSLVSQYINFVVPL